MFSLIVSTYSYYLKLLVLSFFKGWGFRSRICNSRGYLIKTIFLGFTINGREEKLPFFIIYLSFLLFHLTEVYEYL